MIKREQILMLCVGVLLISCIYLLWKNRQLSKLTEASNKPQPKFTEHNLEPELVHDPEPEAVHEPEQEVVNEAEPDFELNDIPMEEEQQEEEITQGEINNYLIEEEIPEDLQKEIDNLNLDETLVDNQEEMIEEIIIDQRPDDDELTRLEMEIKEKFENPPVIEDNTIEIELPPVEVLDVEVTMPNKEENEVNVGVEVPDLLNSIPKEEYTEEMLNNMNLKKLTEICRNKKLKLKGKKSELIDRILKAN